MWGGRAFHQWNLLVSLVGRAQEGMTPGRQDGCGRMTSGQHGMVREGCFPGKMRDISECLSEATKVREEEEGMKEKEVKSKGERER